MKISSVLLIVIVVMSVISMLCIWMYPSVHDFMASNTMWNGVRGFSDEFETDNIETLTDLPDLPEEVALIAIPYIDYTKSELSILDRFVKNGGTLLLMDDYGYGNSILERFGVGMRFSHRPLLDPLFCHKNQWMPKITEFSPDVVEGGIEALVLNHATVLINPAEAEVLAWSSDTSFLDVNENESRDEDEPEGPFPVAARLSYGRGMILAVSDPSILINSMMDRDDNYDFIALLTRAHDGGQKSLINDFSHLSKAPLDASKTMLFDTRAVMASPYLLLGIIAVTFAIVSRYTIYSEARRNN